MSQHRPRKVIAKNGSSPRPANPPRPLKTARTASVQRNGPQKSGQNRPSAQRPVQSVQSGQRNSLSNKTAKRTASREEINRKLRTQTPSRREEVRRVKRIGGSAKNIEVKRHDKTSKQKFYVKKKREALGKLVLARLVLFFIIFVLMFSCVAAIFTLRLHAGVNDNAKAYTLILGEEPDPNADSDKNAAEPTYITIPKHCATKHDTLYIPVSALSEICNLTVTGTSDDLRYIPRDSNGHHMRFLAETNIAYINGAKIRMIAPSFVDGGKLYIPLDFLQKYSQGLVIAPDDTKKTIRITKYIEGYDALSDTDIYAPLTFIGGDTQPLTPIPEDQASDVE